MAGRRALAAAVFLWAALYGADGWAITRTWLGGNGNNNGQRTDWNRAANWSGVPVAVPQAGDIVIIPTNPVGNPNPGYFPTLGGNSNNLIQITVATGATLTVNGTLNLNGTVSPVIDGQGTIAGTGIIAVSNGPVGGILVNDTMSLCAMTVNAAGAGNLSIPAGKTVTVNGALTLTQPELRIGAGAGGATLDVNGALTVAAGATLNMAGAGGTLKVAGNFTLTGGWSAGTSTLFLDPTANQTLNVATGAPREFHAITIQTDAGNQQISGDRVTPNAGIIVRNDLNILRGQFQIGAFTVEVRGNVTSGPPNQSQLDFTAAGTLLARGNVELGSLSQITSQVQGPFATIVMAGPFIPPLPAPPPVPVTTTFHMNATAGSQYHDLDALRISNPAGVIVLDNANADFTVNGQLQIDPGCKLTVKDVFDPESPLIMGANSELRLENIISADSTILGSTFTASAGSTVVYAGLNVNQIVYAQQNNGTQIPYQNLTIDNNGLNATQQNVATTLLVNGNFTIFDAAATFQGAAGRNMTVRQSFIDNGTFTHLGNTVTMGGIGSITGTAATLTFNNLLIDGATADVTAQRSFTTAATFSVNLGTLTTSGTLTMTANAGMSVGNGGTGPAILNLSGNATLSVADAQTFSVNAADGLFMTRAVAGAIPTLTSPGRMVTSVNGQVDLFGLNFSKADYRGLYISQTATLIRLRDVKFTNIATIQGPTSGPGAVTDPQRRHLTIRSPGIDFDCPGCFFGAVPAGSFNVWALDTSAGGTLVRLRFEERSNVDDPATVIGGPGAGETWDGDDDTNDDGVIAAPEASTTLHGGAIVQWVYTANIDMTGVVQGFPEPAFDWNTGIYYSTYVVMRQGAGPDTVYVLGADGDLKPGATPGSIVKFSPVAGSGNIVGPLFWTTETGIGRIVYFGTSTGYVYKLVDNGTSLDFPAGFWTNPFRDTSVLDSVTTPITSDQASIYFGGSDIQGATTQHSIYRLPTNPALPIPPATLPIGYARASAASNLPIHSALSWLDVGGGRYLYSASDAVGAPAVSNIYRINAGGAMAIDATVTSTSSFLAPTSLPLNVVYVGESNGRMHGLQALGGFTPAPGFPFTVGLGSGILGGAGWDSDTTRLLYGNENGELYTLNISKYVSAWTVGSTYYVLPTTGSPIRGMPLAQGGVYYVPNTVGRLFLIDGWNGNVPPPPTTYQRIFLTYNFGTVALGDLSRDSFGSGRIYVATAGGKLYAISPATDPTAAK